MRKLLLNSFQTLIVFIISIFLLFIVGWIYDSNIYLPLPYIFKHAFFFYISGLLIIKFYCNNMHEDLLSLFLGLVIIFPITKQIIANILIDYLGYKIIGIICILYIFAIVIDKFTKIIKRWGISLISYEEKYASQMSKFSWFLQ